MATALFNSSTQYTFKYTKSYLIKTSCVVIIISWTELFRYCVCAFRWTVSVFLFLRLSLSHTSLSLHSARRLLCNAPVRCTSRRHDSDYTWKTCPCDTWDRWWVHLLKHSSLCVHTHVHTLLSQMSASCASFFVLLVFCFPSLCTPLPAALSALSFRQI